MVTTNKEKLIDRLTKTSDGFELVDVKFSMGSERYISEEAFCGEVLSGLEQVASGQVKAMKLEEIDGNLILRTPAEFLS